MRPRARNPSAHGAIRRGRRFVFMWQSTSQGEGRFRLSAESGVNRLTETGMRSSFVQASAAGARGFEGTAKVFSPVTSVEPRAMQSLSRSCAPAVPVVASDQLSYQGTQLATRNAPFTAFWTQRQILATETFAFRPAVATVAANHLWKPINGGDPPLPARDLHLT